MCKHIDDDDSITRPARKVDEMLMDPRNIRPVAVVFTVCCWLWSSSTMGEGYKLECCS